MNKELSSFDVGPRTAPLFHSVVELADAYMQLSVPRFECPRQIPPSVHFVGAPPIVPGQAPLSALAHDLDGSRQVVLVTQGTVANHNFGLLIAPTLAALGDEPDVLVVATTGATRVHEDVFDRSIDVQILRLRRKLERDPSIPEIIQTERGVGYVFAGQVERY